MHALMRAKSENGYLFLIRKEDWRELWDALTVHPRYASDLVSFENLLVRGVPVVHLKNADELLGTRHYALIHTDKFFELAKKESE